MELFLTPDTYAPSLDEHGRYADVVPHIRHGIKCVCGTRHDKTYTHSTFSAHIKTKAHQKWLASMNLNRGNHYAELTKCRDLVIAQKSIIAKLETQLHVKSLTIDYLTEQLSALKSPPPMTNSLLDIE
jgi:hypothetical protein